MTKVGQCLIVKPIDIEFMKNQGNSDYFVEENDFFFIDTENIDQHCSKYQLEQTVTGRLFVGSMNYEELLMEIASQEFYYIDHQNNTKFRPVLKNESFEICAVKTIKHGSKAYLKIVKNKPNVVTRSQSKTKIDNTDHNSSQTNNSQFTRKSLVPSSAQKPRVSLQKQSLSQSQQLKINNTDASSQPNTSRLTRKSLVPNSSQKPRESSQKQNSDNRQELADKNLNSQNLQTGLKKSFETQMLNINEILSSVTKSILESTNQIKKDTNKSLEIKDNMLKTFTKNNETLEELKNKVCLLETDINNINITLDQVVDGINDLKCRFDKFNQFFKNVENWIEDVSSQNPTVVYEKKNVEKENSVVLASTAQNTIDNLNTTNSNSPKKRKLSKENDSIKKNKSIHSSEDRTEVIETARNKPIENDNSSISTGKKTTVDRDTAHNKIFTKLLIKKGITDLSKVFNDDKNKYNKLKSKFAQKLKGFDEKYIKKAWKLGLKSFNNLKLRYPAKFQGLIDDHKKKKQNK